MEQSSKHSSYHEKAKDMSPGDPLDLLKGISDLFVSYEPNFGFENTLEFSSNKRTGWSLLSHSILNKFAPRHSIFLQELRKKKETEEKIELERIERIKEQQRLRKERRMEKRAHNRTKSTQRDYYGYISVEKPRAKKDKIEENQDEDEIYKQASNFDKTRNECGEKCKLKRLCSITAREETSNVLPSLRSYITDDRAYFNCSEQPNNKISSNRYYSSKHICDLSMPYTDASSQNKFLGGSNQSGFISLNNTNGSRASSVSRIDQSISSCDLTSACIPKVQNTLPSINESSNSVNFKEKQRIFIQQIEAKNNESLLKSMRYLQVSQDHELKFKEKEKIMSKEVDNMLNVKVLEKKVKHILAKKPEPKHKIQSVCPFTENKYIKDVYVKNIVPDIIGAHKKNKKKKRTKKGSKIRKVNKSQIRIEDNCDKRINLNNSCIIVDEASISKQELL